MFKVIKDLIEPLRTLETPSIHHPESNMLSHTAQVTLAAARRILEVPTRFRRAFMLAAALHDVGKPISVERNGTTHGHEADSVALISPLFGPESDVVWLVKNHLRIMHIDEMRKSKRDALTHDPRFDTLRILRECDIEGRRADFVLDVEQERRFWDIVHTWTLD